MTLVRAVISHPEEWPVRNTCYISTLAGNTWTVLSSDLFCHIYFVSLVLRIRHICHLLNALYVPWPYTLTCLINLMALLQQICDESDYSHYGSSLTCKVLGNYYSYLHNKKKSWTNWKPQLFLDSADNWGHGANCCHWEINR